jgi:phosphopantothenoylcysteine decarboxylase/phosphopantothenate--cysteine ligase
MIAANQVGDGLAFDCDDNAITMYWPGGKREFERADKALLAAQLIGVVAERFAAAGARAAPVSATSGPKSGSAAAG